MIKATNNPVKDRLSGQYTQYKVRREHSGFDGLTLRLPHLFSIDYFLKKLNETGHFGREVRVKRTRLLNIYQKNGDGIDDGLKLIIGYPRNDCNTIISKPMVYQNIGAFQAKLNLIFGEELLTNCNVVRLDCAINLCHNVAEIISGLNVRYKRKQGDHDSGVLEGIRFGSYPNVINVYDYGERHRTDSVETRIENQFRGRYLPINSYPEFLKIDEICNGGDFRHFKNISLRRVILNPQSCVQSIPMGVRYGRLQELLPLLGYSLARKRLDRGRNFTRDYGRFLNISSQVFPIEAIFTDIVNHFFQNTRGLYESTN